MAIRRRRRKRKKRREKVKTRTIKLLLKPIRIDMLAGRFGKRFKRLIATQKRAEKARIDKLNLVRSIITREKTRIIREIKESEPSSIYELAKSLKRDIKSVRDDIKQLEKVGFIKLKTIKEKRTKIIRVKPELAIGRLNITIEFV